MKKGFTIIEMLAVLIILGIILMIAIPSVGGFTGIVNKNRIKSDAETFEMLVRNKINKDSSIEINGSAYFYLDSINKNELNGIYHEKSYVVVSNCKYINNNSKLGDNYRCSGYGIYLYDKQTGYSYEKPINKEYNDETIKKKTIEQLSQDLLNNIRKCEDKETWCDVKSIVQNDFERIESIAKNSVPTNLNNNEFFYYLVGNFENQNELRLEFKYIDTSYIKYDKDKKVIAYHLYSKEKDFGISKYYDYNKFSGLQQINSKYTENICKDSTVVEGGCVKSE